MSKKAFQLSRWMDPVNVVISLSTRARKTPAIGKRALLISSMRRSFDPASATIAAASAERPSFPFGSLADPALKRSLTFNCGSAVFWTTKETSAAAPVSGAPGARDAREGSFAITSGIGCCETVATTRVGSVKYFFAAACRSAGVNDA
jgi:hypothetical protein